MSKNTKTWSYVDDLKKKGCPNCNEKWSHSYFTFYREVDSKTLSLKRDAHLLAKHLLSGAKKSIEKIWMYECPKCHKKNFFLNDDFETVL